MSIDVEQLANWNRQFFQVVRLNRAMGMDITALGRGTASMRLPYREDLVGDPVAGTLHGGAITSLLDAACGAAVFMALETPDAVATLDLRIDYLRRGEPGREVIADAVCFKRTRSVAFVRAFAHHGDPDDPVAAAAGAFMVGTHMLGLVR